MQLVNSGCLNMFNYIPSCWLKSSFLEWLALLDSLLYPTENELSGSRNWKCILSWWESFNNNLNIFSSSSLLCYTIRGNQKCYYQNNNLPNFFLNLMKVCRVTPGHYGCPFRNINIVLFFLFNVWLILKKFDDFCNLCVLF